MLVLHCRKLIALASLYCAIAGCYAARSQTPCPQPFEWKPLQEKICHYNQPCSLNQPVTPGSLILLPEIGACNGVTCLNVSDNQGNDWKTALVVEQYNGIPLQYVSSAKGGPLTVHLTAGTGWLWHLYEYPCKVATGCVPHVPEDKPACCVGSYTDAGLTPAGVEIHDNAAWTRRVETIGPCELLAGWALVGQGTVKAGPYFNLRQVSGGPYVFLAFEDSTVPIPGYVMGSMSWTYPNAWNMGTIPFKMGGCPQ